MIRFQTKGLARTAVPLTGQISKGEIILHVGERSGIDQNNRLGIKNPKPDNLFSRSLLFYNFIANRVRKMIEKLILVTGVAGRKKEYCLGEKIITGENFLDLPNERFGLMSEQNDQS